MNLVHEPWIPVITGDGRRFTLGLADVVDRAADIADIEGDAPHVRIALLRLLLAVIHRAARGPVSFEEWGSWWERPEVPFGKASEYLAAHADAFELFDPDRPFWQCPELTDEHAREAAKLVPSLASGNNRVWFDHTSVARPARLTPAEAARWLVALQMFQTGGILTGFPSGRGTSVHAPLAGAAVVCAIAVTLQRTLLLNLVRYDPASELPFAGSGEAEADVPVWERIPPPGEPGKRVPAGYVDWLTWPSRRVRLFVSDGAVDQVAITPGDRLPDGVERSTFETMVPRRASGRGRVLVDLRFSPDRAVWRESSAILLRESVAEEALWRRARVVDHVDELIARSVLPPDTYVGVTVAGIAVDRSKYLDWGEDQIGVSGKLLTDESKGRVILEAVKAAEDVARETGRAAQSSYAEADGRGGGGASSAQDRCRGHLWAALGLHFHGLLTALAADDEEAPDRWSTVLSREALAAFDATAAPARFGDELRARIRAESRLRRRLAHRLNQFREVAKAYLGGAA